MPSVEMLGMDADQLAGVSADLTPEHTVVVLVNPALFYSTMSRF